MKSLMKKALIICLLVSLMLVLFAGSAFALHTQDVQGSRCFRCHSTHQGISGLLLSPTAGNAAWQDKYEVTASTNCLACHDGTASRSVTTMTPNANYPMQSGVFDISVLMGTTAPYANMSSHNVGIASAYFSPIDQAPGNKNLGHYATLLPELHCSSCHNPHGTNGAHKYMQFNPNNSVDGKFYLGGNWPAYMANKTEMASVTLTRQADGTYQAAATQAPWLRAYIYNRGDNAGRYIKFPVAVKIGEDWIFQRANTSLTTVNFTVNAITGTVKFDGATANPGEDVLTLQAKVFLPVRVQQASTYVGSYKAEDGTDKTMNVRTFQAGNYGNTVNRWCASCHGNFDIRSRTGQPYEEDGVTYHGHNVYRGWAQSYATPYTVNGYNATTAGVGSFPTSGTVAMEGNCLSCHFAHGTNVNLMMDSLKQIVGSRVITSSHGAQNDPNPANKRYFAGSVCIRCHYDSHGEGLVWDSQIRPEEYRWQ
jgi:hypothetical protein